MRLIHAFLVATLTASAASATSVNLRWQAGAASAGSITGIGTSSVTLAPSAVATLTLDIRINVDAAGLRYAFVSLEFDRDLRNELDIISFEELTWTGMMTMTAALPKLEPFVLGLSATPESTSTQIGKLYTFDVVTVSNASDCCPVNTTIAFGRVVFVTNHKGGGDDGADIFSGVFNEGIDDLYDIDGDVVSSTATFGTARLNQIPEPSTLGLLGLGLGVLVAARPGRRAA